MELRQNSNSKLQSKYQQKLKRWLVGLEFTRENNQNKRKMVLSMIYNRDVSEWVTLRWPRRK